MRRWHRFLVAAGLCAGMVTQAPRAASATLYDRLGGPAGVRAIAANAIGLFMVDPRLHAYFDDINPDYLRPHFATFICKIADGPCTYHGRSMAAVHKGLHIDQAAFDRVVEDLQIAMSRAGVPFWTQNQLLARLAPMERAIVTR